MTWLCSALFILGRLIVAAAETDATLSQRQELKGDVEADDTSPLVGPTVLGEEPVTLDPEARPAALPER